MKLLAIAGFCLVIAFLCTNGGSIVFAESSESGHTIGVNDFVDFWAASRLLMSGRNPFSPTEVLELQQSVGYNDPKPLLMWNPPWTLSFILPIGVFDHELSQFIWMLLHAFVIMFAAQKLWALYFPNSRSYSPWIIVITFGPTMMVLIIGQITPLVLLGIVLFLHFATKNQPFAAGLSTTLISIKPHLIYLFWIGLLFWIWKQRCWRLAYGAILGGLAIAIIPMIINPAIYYQFFEMYRFPGRSTPFELPAPSIGSFLTLYVPHGDLPIQFLPPLLGIIWFVWYWQNFKDSWNWCEQVPIMALLSLTLSPYAWTYDQVILLPAVIHGFAIANRLQSSWYKLALGFLYVSVNAVYVVGKFFVTTDSYYFWLSPACLMLYLGARALYRNAIFSSLGDYTERSNQLT